MHLPCHKDEKIQDAVIIGCLFAWAMPGSPPVEAIGGKICRVFGMVL
jgi:hypothetical protein